MSSDHSIFAKRSDQTPKLSYDAANLESGNTTSTDNTPSTVSNLLNTVKGYVKLGSDEENTNTNNTPENTGYFNSFKNTISKTIEVEQSYKTFFIVLSVGVGLIIFSLLFLPIVWIAPKKFVSLFSLGSLTTLISFIFLQGTKAYFDMLFSKSRALFSVLFISSIFLGVYFAFNDTYYLISLICAIVQFITLIVFALSFIPGGSHGISFITSMLMSPVMGLWSRITGSA